MLNKFTCLFLMLFIITSYNSASAQWVQTSTGITGGNVKSITVSGSKVYAGMVFIFLITTEYPGLSHLLKTYPLFH